MLEQLVKEHVRTRKLIDLNLRPPPLQRFVFMNPQTHAKPAVSMVEQMLTPLVTQLSKPPTATGDHANRETKNHSGQHRNPWQTPSP
jgi:hypothetical protein